MEPKRFDHLSRALAAHGPRRSVLGLLAAVPVVGGLLGILTPEETEAAGRRKRRKKAHKHGKGRRRKHKRKKKCTPESVAQTCAGKCGSVQNNCKQTANCGSCDCSPACEPCFTCQGSAGAPGTCVPQETGTRCGVATICESGMLLPQGSCNGRGTCEPGTAVPCVPYTQCDGNACATSCTTDTDCVEGSFCNGESQCVGDLPNGESCSHGGQCTSSFCVDRVCCNSACDAACQACNNSGSVGTCAVEPDLSTCGSGNVCCSGSCQACCNSVQCPTPTLPICRSGSCVACTAHPAGCPSGTCCAGDGSCQSGTTNMACGSGGECEVCTGQDQCQDQTCVCVPDCTDRNCGSNGCTGSCGTCTGSQTCGGGGTDGVCGCTPTTCIAQNKNCGPLPDGCGGIVSCGSCPFPGQPCTNNVCGTCVPNCTGKACGAGDDCGGTCTACSPTCLTGGCPSGQGCREGTCAVTGRTYDCTCGDGTVRSACGPANCGGQPSTDFCTAQCANHGGYAGITCRGDTGSCFV